MAADAVGAVSYQHTISPGQTSLGEFRADQTCDVAIAPMPEQHNLQSLCPITLRDTFISAAPHQGAVDMCSSGKTNANGLLCNVSTTGGKYGYRTEAAQFQTAIRARAHSARVGLIIDNNESGGGGNTNTWLDYQSVDNGIGVIVNDRNGNKYGHGDSNILVNPEVHGGACGIAMLTKSVLRVVAGTYEYVGKPDEAAGSMHFDPNTNTAYYSFELGSLAQDVRARLIEIPRCAVYMRNGRIYWDNPSLRNGDRAPFHGIIENDAELIITNPEGGQSVWQQLIARDRAQIHCNGHWALTGTFFGCASFPSSINMQGQGWSHMAIFVGLPGERPHAWPLQNDATHIDPRQPDFGPIGRAVSDSPLGLATRIRLVPNVPAITGNLTARTGYQRVRHAGVSFSLYAHHDVSIEVMGIFGAPKKLPMKAGELRHFRYVEPGREPDESGYGRWPDWGIRLLSDAAADVDISDVMLVIDREECPRREDLNKFLSWGVR